MQNIKIYLKEIDLPPSSTGSYSLCFVEGEEGIQVAAIKEDGTKEPENFIIYEEEIIYQLNHTKRRKKRQNQIKHQCKSLARFPKVSDIHNYLIF